MKRASVGRVLAVAGLGLAGLCRCSQVGAVPDAAGQIPTTEAAAEQDDAASVLVPQGDGWREAPNAAMHLKGLIRLDVTVRDAAGAAVPGLGQEDFTVLDDGQPESLVAFRPSHATGRPSPDASVIVLLDTLALPPELATEERQQVVAFLRAEGGRLRWPVTVYTFEDSGFYRTAKASQDGNAVADAVLADGKKDPLSLQTPVQANSLFMQDAAQQAAQLRQSSAEAAPTSTGVSALATIAAAADLVPGRKVLLWVGPGLRDAGSGAYPDPEFRKLAARREQPSQTPFGDYTPSKVTKAPVRQAIFDGAYWILTLLRQAGITVDVFSVGEKEWRRKKWSGILDKDNEAKWMRLVNAWKPYQDGPDGPEHANRIDLYKKVLAVESGGRVLPDENDIARQMAECVRAADAWYTLTFNPAPAGHADDLHSLEVKVRPAGLTAETVRAYYDEPYYTDPPYGGARPVTIAGLESLLHAAHGGSEQLRALEGIALTERLTQAEQAKLHADLHGGKPQEALDLLADEAEFEPPPKSEMPADPAPVAAEQRQMIERARQYLEKTIPRLPDFFAVRQAEHFASTAAFHEESTNLAAAPLHQIDAAKANVLYRKGAEVVLGKAPASDGAQPALHTYGTFGPALFTLRAALSYTQGVSWSRWEQGTAGREAVFAFAVPNTVPHQYAVIGCCVPDRGGDVPFKLLPGYHGEVAIDPETGAVLRFQLQADLAGFAPAKLSDIMVAYGPVTIGGRTYIVPQRSVSLSRVRVMAFLHNWNLSFRAWGPEQTSIEVFAFHHYREFRASVKVLPGFEPMGNEPN